MVNEEYRLKKLARLVADRRAVLDLGCARIRNRHLSNARVVGLDLESFEPPANYTESVVGDVTELPTPFEPMSFDAIIAGELLEHLENPLAFLRGCCQTLAPGGILALSTPNPNSPFERVLTLTLSRRFFYTENHVLLFPQRWLIRVLERCGFEDVHLYSGGFPIPGLGLVPFPRPWCYQTIATAIKPV